MRGPDPFREFSLFPSSLFVRGRMYSSRGKGLIMGISRLASSRGDDARRAIKGRLGRARRGHPLKPQLYLRCLATKIGRRESGDGATMH